MDIEDFTIINDPRAQAVHDFEIAFYNHDIETVSSFLEPDFVWEIAGADRLEGRSAFINEAIKNPMNWGIGISFEGVLASRTQAAAWGFFQAQARLWMAYANLYELVDADELRIKKITTIYHPSTRTT